MRAGQGVFHWDNGPYRGFGQTDGYTPNMALYPDEMARQPTIKPDGRVPGRDRRQHQRWVVRERRSGFDRRRTVSGSPVSTALQTELLRLRDRPRRLAELLILINILSVIDLVVTLVVLQMGAVELNPIMARLLEFGPAPAALAKISVVVAATIGLWFLRRHRAALSTALLLLVIYGTLVTMELVSLVWRVV